MSIPNIKVSPKPFSPDERALALFIQDCEMLPEGLRNQKIEDLNFDAIIDFLGHLMTEAQNMKNGIRARDNFMSYTMHISDISVMFLNNPTFIEEQSPFIEGTSK